MWYFFPKAVKETRVVALVCIGVTAEKPMMLSKAFMQLICSWVLVLLVLLVRVSTSYKLICSGSPASSGGWVMEQLWLSQWIRTHQITVYREKADEALLQRSSSFSCVLRLCEQWTRPREVLALCYVHTIFLAPLLYSFSDAPSTKQLVLRIWCLWCYICMGCTLLSHCFLGAIMCLSPFLCKSHT